MPNKNKIKLQLAKARWWELLCKMKHSTLNEKEQMQLAMLPLIIRDANPIEYDYLNSFLEFEASKKLWENLEEYSKTIKDRL